MTSVVTAPSTKRVAFVAAFVSVCAIVGFSSAEHRPDLANRVAFAAAAMAVALVAASYRNVLPYVLVFVVGAGDISNDLGFVDAFTITKIGGLVILAAYVLVHRDEFGPGRPWWGFAPEWRAVGWSSVLLVAFFVASVAWSAARSTGILTAGSLVAQLALLWLVVRASRGPEDLRHFTGALILFGTACAAQALWAALPGLAAPLDPHNQVRTDSFAGNANFTALYAGLAGILLLARAVRGGRSWGWLPRWLEIPLLALLVAGILVTGSRSGLGTFLAGAVAAIALAFLAEPRRAGGRLGKTMLRFAPIAVVLVIAAPLVANFFLRDPLRFGHVRSDLLSTGTSIFESHWIAGAGLGAARLVDDGHPVHNTFVWALAEGGMVGGILLLLVAASTIAALLYVLRRARSRPGWRLLGSDVGVPAIVAALAVFSLFHDMETNKFTWVVLGVVAGLRNVASTE